MRKKLIASFSTATEESSTMNHSKRVGELRIADYFRSSNERNAPESTQNDNIDKEIIGENKRNFMFN